MLRVSREWLRRAIDQLVNNSIRAMDRSKEKTLTIKSFRKNNSANIQIIDSGPGIPKKILEKLFQEPIPKKKSEKGSGIALLLVQLILQTYDGDIKVVSTGERGTKMEISFPIEK